MNALHSCIFLLILVLFSEKSESFLKATKESNSSQFNITTKQHPSPSFQLPKLTDDSFNVNLSDQAYVPKSSQSNRLKRTPKRINNRLKLNFNGHLNQSKSLKIEKHSEKSNLFTPRTIFQETSRIEKIAERNIHHNKRETSPISDQYEDFNHNEDADDDHQNVDVEHKKEKHTKIKIKHHHHHHHHNHIREVVKKVREPYPVETIVHVPVEKIVEKIVHVPKVVEKIVNVPYEKIVHIAKPYPVEKILEKKVPYPVEKVIHVPVERIVEKIVHVPKPYPVEKIVEKIVHIPVEKVVEKVIHIPKPYPVEKIVNKLIHVPRPYPVIKPVPYPVEFKVPMHYERQQLPNHNELKNAEVANEESRKKSNTNVENIKGNVHPFQFEKVNQPDHITKENFEEQQSFKANTFPDYGNIEQHNRLKTLYNMQSQYPVHNYDIVENNSGTSNNFQENDNQLLSFDTQQKSENTNSPALESLLNYRNRNYVLNRDMQEQASENNYHIFTIGSPTALAYQMFEVSPRPFENPFLKKT